jgi:antirestriction protein
LDATLEPDELADAIQFILKNSHEPGAEEHGIFDYDGFGEGVGSLLGEWASLATVSRIAQSITEHGDAFAAWAAYVGPEQTEQLDRFEDHYLGEWEPSRRMPRSCCKRAKSTASSTKRRSGCSPTSL